MNFIKTFFKSSFILFLVLMLFVTVCHFLQINDNINVSFKETVLVHKKTVYQEKKEPVVVKTFKEPIIKNISIKTDQIDETINDETSDLNENIEGLDLEKLKTKIADIQSEQEFFDALLNNTMLEPADYQDEYGNFRMNLFQEFSLNLIGKIETMELPEELKKFKDLVGENKAIEMDEKTKLLIKNVYRDLYNKEVVQLNQEENSYPIID